MRQTGQGDTTEGGLATAPRGRWPPEVDAAADVFERRFGVAFSTLTLFSGADLARLHADDPSAGLPPAVDYDSDAGPLVAESLTTMTRVANGDRDLESRREYVDALDALYN